MRTLHRHFVRRSKLSPKNQEIFQSVVQIAQNLGPEAKLPTVQQLRRDFGVSIATLDSVLAHLESQNIIYRRQGSGIYVSPYLHKKTVGLICSPEFFRAGTSPFWAEIVEGMRKRATSEGEVFRFYLSLPSSRSDVPVHEDLQTDVAEHRLEGVFFIGNNLDVVNWLEAQNMAVVTFAGRGHYKVTLDYDDLIIQSVEALSKAGCKRIGLMSPFQYRAENPKLHFSSYTRVFSAALKEKGLNYHPCLIWDANNIAGAENQTYQEQGFEATKRMFNAQNMVHPDGIVIIDDMMTRGALVAMQKLDIHPLHEVQIASHTNRSSAVLHGYEQDLIIIEIDPTEIVETMFEMLNTLMSEGELANPTVQVKAHLKNAQHLRDF